MTWSSPGRRSAPPGEALGLAGLDGRTASAILWTRRADAAIEELATAGLTEITCLIHQNLVPG